MKISSSKGVGDFYEAIPTLIIVTTGLLVFMLTTINAYSGYVGHQAKARLENKTLELIELARSYEGFLYEGQGYRAGYFSATKLEELKANKTLASQKFKSTFNPDFEFKIELVDVSSYYKKYDFEFSTNESMNPKLGLYRLESSVNIVVSDIEIHAAKLIVSVWS
ncbi:MAG: hypothetical protein AB1485_07150 [Candidatus Thermoplasmatota archaeon]